MRLNSILLSGDRDRNLWLLTLAVAAGILLASGSAPWLVSFPAGWELPIASTVDVLMQWFVGNFKWLFRILSGALEMPLRGLQGLLSWLPWLTTAAVVVLVAWQGGGWRTGSIVIVGLVYIIGVGYWQECISTLSLVIVCIPLAVMIGFWIGVWGHRSPKANAVIQTVLDFMQTVPAFAYLIPILLLFGFGPVVGLIASLVFSMPPMVRNTILGLSRVPAVVLESGVMSGCTRRQRFWWIEVPTALPQLLIGVNQTTMAALAMVIIAAIIGGFDDIGWEVLSSMRKADFGQSVLSGLVIVALAIMLDRITSAYAAQRLPTASHCGLNPVRFALALAGLVATTLIVAWFVPPLWNWPRDWVYFPARGLNGAVQWIIVNLGSVLEAVRDFFLFYILLPLKLGLRRAIAPFTWGFSMTPAIATGYWIAVVLLTALAWIARGWKPAAAVLALSGILFYGITGLPWPAVLAVMTLLAWHLAGPRVAAFVFCSLAYLLLGGIWKPAMLSIYLCGAAVAVCILLGGLMGAWAAHSSVVSSVIRPINDALQTMPQFVLLIPALMLFQVGEFPALMAIVAYAIVPMIRYTEQGLRGVPPTAIEAGITSGCTPVQLFWQIKLKLALPQMLLGVNQTILFGLAMLVIAALVGTTGLGQEIYLALGKADAGRGIVGGVGMALIAMSADRMIQGYVRRNQNVTWSG